MLALGRLAGRTAWILLAGERRRSLEHLARAFPERGEAERRAIGRASFEHLGQVALELGKLRSLDLERYVELPPSARAALDDGLAKGRGVLAVTGHVGNWELLLRRCIVAGYPAVAVGREPDDPRARAMLARVRGDEHTIWRGEPRAGRKLLSAFRENRIVAMLIDQDTRVQGVFVPFFGELAHTPRAPADLALRTGAAIVAAFIHRREGGGHRIEIRPVEPAGDPVALTAAMTLAIENEIRAVPHEWVWMHRRWRTRPEPPPQP